MINLSRRRVLLGLLAAPIVVRSGLLMPVKRPFLEPAVFPHVRRYVCVAAYSEDPDGKLIGHFEEMGKEKSLLLGWRDWESATLYKTGDIVEVEALIGPLKVG